MRRAFKLTFLLAKFLAFFIAILFFSFIVKSSVFAVTLFSTEFESNSVDPWVSSGGGSTATISADVFRAGSHSIKIQHDKTSSYGFQTIIPNIEGGMFYEASGYGKTLDNNTASLFIRIAWYTSTDGSGSQLSSPNDSNIITGIGDWSLLEAKSIQSPATANSAKVRLVLTSRTSGQLASAYFDDIVFKESVAPTSTPSPTPTNTPTPASSPTTKPTATLTPTKTPTPEPSNTLTPTLDEEMVTPSTDKNFPTAVLGESFIASPSVDQLSPTPIIKTLGSSQNNLSIFLIGIGIIFLTACGILGFKSYKERQRESDI